MLRLISGAVTKLSAATGEPFSTTVYSPLLPRWLCLVLHRIHPSLQLLIRRQINNHQVQHILLQNPLHNAFPPPSLPRRLRRDILSPPNRPPNPLRRPPATSPSAGIYKSPGNQRHQTA